MLKGDYLPQVVEILIGGIPTILEVHLMYLFMSLGKILLQGSISTNLFDPKSHPVDLRNVEVCIQLLGNINFVTDIILPGVHFVTLDGSCPSFPISFIVYLSLLHEFRSWGIGFCDRHFAGSPE